MWLQSGISRQIFMLAIFDIAENDPVCAFVQKNKFHPRQFPFWWEENVIIQHI